MARNEGHLQALRALRHALLLALAAALCLTCLPTDDPADDHDNPVPFAASPGLPRYQSLAFVELPGAEFNAVGGNLLLRAPGLSIDTRLGTQQIAPLYNSSTREWLWSFEMSYRDTVFRDATGAEHNTHGFANGDWIIGTHWIKLDARRIKSLGGLVHEFDATGRLESIHWSSSEHPRLVFDGAEIAGAQRTTAIRQCRAAGLCQPVVAIDYDDAGRVRSLTDRAGRRALYDVDANGMIAEARDALALERGANGARYAYWDRDRLLAQTTPEGVTTEYQTGNFSGRLLRVVLHGDAAGARYEIDYEAPDANQREDLKRWRTWITDPAGARWGFEYDSDGRVRTRSLPTGEQLDYAWANRNVTRITRPDGSETVWEHLSQDKVRRIDPSGNEVTLDFRLQDGENRKNPYERPIDRITDSLGPVERRGYEGGRLRWVENGAGERTELAYDAEGMIARIRAPFGATLELSDYGEHGQPATLRQAGSSETRSYDAVGNLLSRSTDALLDLRPGGEVARRYDANRNLGEVLLADAPLDGEPQTQALRIESRSDGQPLRIERPGGGVIAFDYDGRGRLVARREWHDGSWQTTVFGYDTAGRMNLREFPNGMRREIESDASGRPVRLRALRDGRVEHEARFGYELGRHTRVEETGAAAPETLDYDAAGRLVRIHFAGGETLEFAHDLRDRPVAETYRLPDGSPLAQLLRGFDGAGRETALADGENGLIERRYTQGLLTQQSYGNGLVQQIDHDLATGQRIAATTDHPLQGLAEDWRLELAALAGGNVQVESRQWLFASAEEVVEIHELGSAASGAAAGPRLLASGGGGAMLAYAYDALGNLREDGAGRRFVHDATGERLLRVEDAAGALLLDYVYDAAGFVTRRGDEALAWDANGRITRLGERLEVEWDALQRLRRRATPDEVVVYRFGGRVAFDADGAPLRLEVGEVEVGLGGAETRYDHSDSRGNVTWVSGNDGALRARQAYEAYGPLPDEADGVMHRSFAGGLPLDDLVLLGGRLLDPLAARFLAPDPVAALVNDYNYAQSNPVWFWDPSGLLPAASPGIQRAQSMQQLAGWMIVAGAELTAIGAIMLIPPAIPFAVPVLTFGLGLAAQGITSYIQATIELNYETSLDKQSPEGCTCKESNSNPIANGGVGSDVPFEPSTGPAPPPSGAGATGGFSMPGTLHTGSFGGL